MSKAPQDHEDDEEIDSDEQAYIDMLFGDEGFVVDPELEPADFLVIVPAADAEEPPLPGILRE